MTDHDGYSLKRELRRHYARHDVINEIQFEVKFSVKVKSGTHGPNKWFIVDAQVYLFDEIPTDKERDEFKEALLEDIENTVDAEIRTTQRRKVKVVVPPSQQGRLGSSSKSTTKSSIKSKEDAFMESLKASTEVPAFDVHEVVGSLKQNTMEQQIRDAWEEELKRKVDAVVDSAPWRNKEDMRAEGYCNSIKFAQEYGITPHLSNSKFKEPFLGNVDMLFEDFVGHFSENMGVYFSTSMGTIDSILMMYNDVLSLSPSSTAYVRVVQEYFDIVEGTEETYKRKFIDIENVNDDDDDDHKDADEEKQAKKKRRAIDDDSSEDDEPISNRIKETSKPQ